MSSSYDKAEIIAADDIRHHICKMSPEEFNNYTISAKILGRGAFGMVRVGNDKRTDTQVAVKVINKQRLSADDLKNIARECNICSQLYHPHIVQIYGGYEDEHQMYWLLSLAKGGDLLLWIRSLQEPLTSSEIRYVFKQLVEAVSYCHNKNIIHRDIKFENILLKDEVYSYDSADKCDILLSDFGFSINQEPNGPLLEDFPGTPHYAAPQLLRGIPYKGRAADIWSMGVCLYGLAARELPFTDKRDDIDEINYQIMFVNPRLPRDIDPGLKNLIDQMLQKQEHLRIDMAGILSDPWYLDRDGKSSVADHHFDQSYNPYDDLS